MCAAAAFSEDFRYFHKPRKNSVRTRKTHWSHNVSNRVIKLSRSAWSIVTLQVQNTSFISSNIRLTFARNVCVVCVCMCNECTKLNKNIVKSWSTTRGRRQHSKQRNFSDDRRNKKRISRTVFELIFCSSISFYDSHTRIRNGNERNERKKNLKKKRDFCLFSRQKTHIAFRTLWRLWAGSKANTRREWEREIDSNIVINKTTKFFWVHRNAHRTSHMQCEKHLRSFVQRKIN